MEVFGIAITFLSFVIAYQAWQNGRFMKNEMKATKSLLAKMDERSAKMDETSEQRHEEAMKSREETHREVVALLEKGFGNTAELLKRGFGDLSRDVAGIKVAVSK